MTNSERKKLKAEKHNYERWLKANARYETQRPEKRKVTVTGTRISKAALLAALGGILQTSKKSRDKKSSGGFMHRVEDWNNITLTRKFQKI